MARRYGRYAAKVKGRIRRDIETAFCLYSLGTARVGGDVMDGTSKSAGPPSGVVFALGEKAIFKPGDRVRVSTRSPIGHYRVPTYLRGKTGPSRR